MENLWCFKYCSLHINQEEVHIWKCNVLQNTSELDSYWRILTKDEIIKANNFHFEKDKVNYILARGILRNILAFYTKIQPEDIKFCFNKFGKPYLNSAQNVQNLKFNISHSHNNAVYIFTKNIDIGVDIEFSQNIPDLEQVAKLFLSNYEYQYLQNLSNSERHNYFYKIWTLKEAFVKATGLGLSYDLRNVRIEFFQNNNYKIILENENKNLDSWTLQTFLSYKNFSSAFATNQIISNILFFNYD